MSRKSLCWTHDLCVVGGSWWRRRFVLTDVSTHILAHGVLSAAPLTPISSFFLASAHMLLALTAIMHGFRTGLSSFFFLSGPVSSPLSLPRVCLFVCASVTLHHLHLLFFFFLSLSHLFIHLPSLFVCLSSWLSLSPFCIHLPSLTLSLSSGCLPRGR